MSIVEADRHVVEGERRVTEQEVRLVHLRRAGQNVIEAERLLTNLQDLLSQFRHHRDQLVDDQL
jgi:hypothetical protein